MKKPTILTIAGALCALLALPGSADARAQRVLQVPNGSAFSCTLCHTDLAGGTRNAFGDHVFENALDDAPDLVAKAVVWSDLAPLDADGDGVTNGEELGDPSGTWMPGDPDPDIEPTDPGDAEDFPAGGGNNAAGNNAANNGDGGDASASGGDEGCAVAPGATGPAALLFAALGLIWALRRRAA